MLTIILVEINSFSSYTFPVQELLNFWQSENWASYKKFHIKKGYAASVLRRLIATNSNSALVIWHGNPWNKSFFFLKLPRDKFLERVFEVYKRDDAVS